MYKSYMSYYLDSACNKLYCRCPDITAKIHGLDIITYLTKVIGDMTQLIRSRRQAIFTGPVTSVILRF